MRETFVNRDGLRLWTVAEGSGTSIVLISGGPGCCDYLAPIAAMLVDTAQVLRYDASGCGRSDPAPLYSVETCLEDLEAIRREYQIERWIVAGHSWGANLALIYALRYPKRVDGFVCMAGGQMNNDRSWHDEYSRKSDAGLEPALAFDFPPNLEVNAQVNRSMKLYIQRPSLLKEIAQLDRPGLFLYGDDDIRPSWPVEQVAQLLPNADFELLPGANHYIWITHGEVMRGRLRKFTQSAGGSAAWS